MSRARSIKPEFFTDAKIGALPYGARLLFAAIWCHADLRGVFEYNPRQLRVLALPFDEGLTSNKVSEWLKAMEALGLIVRFEVDGKTWGIVRNWDKHQSISTREVEIGTQYPPPPGWTVPPTWPSIIANGVKLKRCKSWLESTLDQDKQDAGTVPEQFPESTPEQFQNGSAHFRTVPEPFQNHTLTHTLTHTQDIKTPPYTPAECIAPKGAHTGTDEPERTYAHAQESTPGQPKAMESTPAPSMHDHVATATTSQQESTPADATEPESKPEPRKRFVKPTLAEVQAYCTERNRGVNPERWMAHYESNGWRVNKNPMRDWKASVRYWEHGETYQRPPKSSPDVDAVPKRLETALAEIQADAGGGETGAAVATKALNAARRLFRVPTEPQLLATYRAAVEDEATQYPADRWPDFRQRIAQDRARERSGTTVPVDNERMQAFIDLEAELRRKVAL